MKAPVAGVSESRLCHRPNTLKVSVFKVQGSRFRVQGSRFRVQGSEFRVD
ncbi:Creatinine amidohydrolase (EC [Olavius algarvensis Delta 1 endosymbiont]|nr:Creatinine amidohydrolase (EC [Olavius algarvensis Delta 1 endosymbiont]